MKAQRCQNLSRRRGLIRKRRTARGPFPSVTSYLCLITLVFTNLSVIEPANSFKSTTPAFQQYRSLAGRRLPKPKNDEASRVAPRALPPNSRAILGGSPSNRASNPQNPSIPRHVALICDGNSRWAKARGLPASAGHAAGADQLVKILGHLDDSGVKYCTLFAFSTENWKRPAKEINDLLKIMEQSCHRFHDYVLSKNAKVQILGDLEDQRIPNGLRHALHKLERDTAEHVASQKDPMTVCFAINYGGKSDILKASLKLAEAISNEELSPEDVNEDMFSSLLSTRHIPDPDLVIRTSGECRLSNFMLWNAAYAELYFTDVLFPDFNKQSWEEALQWYSNRQRKFGGRKAQRVINNGVASS